MLTPALRKEIDMTCEAARDVLRDEHDPEKAAIRERDDRARMEHETQLFNVRIQIESLFSRVQGREALRLEKGTLPDMGKDVGEPYEQTY